MRGAAVSGGGRRRRGRGDAEARVNLFPGASGLVEDGAINYGYDDVVIATGVEGGGRETGE